VNGRRTFLRGFVSVLLSGGAIGGILKILPAKADAREAPPKGQKWYGFGVSVDKCIGCARCLPACPVDAIVGARKRMHTVIAALCTGCELCLPPCPVDCIEMLPTVAVPALADD